MLIDGEDCYSAEKFEDRNPANTDQVLGLFQKGSAADAEKALRRRGGLSPRGAARPGRSGCAGAQGSGVDGPAHL